MLDTIYNRRSIRKYTEKPVEKEKIQELLRAAMYAPTGKNTQLWEFIVCDDKEIMKQFQAFMPYAKMLDEAPCVIIICGNMDRNPIPYYYMGDCGAAAQNILLAAHEMDLGTCWLGIAPLEEKMKSTQKLFDLPENVIPFCGIAVGYPNEVPQVPERFDSGKIHYNKWK